MHNFLSLVSHSSDFHIYIVCNSMHNPFPPPFFFFSLPSYNIDLVIWGRQAILILVLPDDVLQSKD